MNIKSQAIATAIATVLVIGSTAVATTIFLPDSDKSFSVVVEAPTTIEVGDLAIIDAGKTGADSYAYSVTPPVPCHLFDGGTRLVFAGKVPGAYVFVVAAAKGGQVSIAEHTITVSGSTPAPGPDTSFAARLKQAVAAVEEPAKAEHLAALVGNLRSVASMIAAGVISTPEDAITASYNLNVESLGGARQAWLPVRELIAAELNERALPDMAAHSAAWREIADTLEASK